MDISINSGVTYIHAFALPTEQRRLFILALSSRHPIRIPSRLFPGLPIPPQKPQAHNKQTTLQTTRQYKQPPNTPPGRPQPNRQTTGENKATWRLYAHHRNAQAPNRLRPPRCPYLRYVLDAGEDTPRHFEEIGPVADPAWHGIRKDYGAEESEDEEEEGEGEDEDGLFPGGYLGRVFVILHLEGIGSTAREEYEEEEHSVHLISILGIHGDLKRLQKMG